MSEVKIETGKGFEKRLAELVWENCPEQARKTAAGKLALSLDVNSSEIQSQVAKGLTDEVVKAVACDVAAQVKESITEKIINEVAKNVVISVTEGLRTSFASLVEREVVKRVRSQVKSEMDKQFGKNGNSFASAIRKRLNDIVDEELNYRLRFNEPVQSAITDKISALNETNKHSELEPGRKSL